MSVNYTKPSVHEVTLAFYSVDSFPSPVLPVGDLIVETGSRSIVKNKEENVRWIEPAVEQHSSICEIPDKYLRKLEQMPLSSSLLFTVLNSLGLSREDTYKEKCLLKFGLRVVRGTGWTYKYQDSMICEKLQQKRTKSDSRNYSMVPVYGLISHVYSHAYRNGRAGIWVTVDWMGKVELTSEAERFASRTYFITKDSSVQDQQLNLLGTSNLRPLCDYTLMMIDSQKRDDIRGIFRNIKKPGIDYAQNGR